MGCRRTENWLALLSLLRSGWLRAQPGEHFAAQNWKPPRRPNRPPRNQAPVATQISGRTPGHGAGLPLPHLAKPEVRRTPSGQGRRRRPKKPAAGDPVKVNGPIFEGWSKPSLAILITGEQLGYLEPCGCAGLENQKGGLGRRATLVKQLRAEGWPLLPIDLGGLVRRFGQQEELKFQTAIEALRAMDYAAIGWGAEDLKLGAGNLLAATTENDGRPSRFVSANVGLFELDLASPDRYRIIEAGGHKIGVTAILGSEFQKEVHNDDIKLADAQQALAQVVPRLKEKSDYRILLSYAEPGETIRLAKRFPEFQAVVTARGADEPPREPRQIEGTSTWLIEVGHKGMFAVVLGFYDGARPNRSATNGYRSTRDLPTRRKCGLC